MFLRRGDSRLEATDRAGLPPLRAAEVAAAEDGGGGGGGATVTVAAAPTAATCLGLGGAVVQAMRFISLSSTISRWRSRAYRTD